MKEKLIILKKRLFFSNKEEDITLQVNTIAILGVIAVLSLVAFFIILHFYNPVPEMLPTPTK